MNRTRALRALAMGAGALLALTIGHPAQAATVTITDPVGTDFDASGKLVNPLTGDSVVTDADGSSGSTDIKSLTLSTGTQSWAGGPAEGTVTATLVVDGGIPPNGSTNRNDPAWDGPSAKTTGAEYYVYFSNSDKQTNGDNTASGCVDTLRHGRTRDQHGHWRDGFRYYAKFTVEWDGARWRHFLDLGEYNPSPPPDSGHFPYTGRNLAKASLSITAGADTTIEIKFAGAQDIADPNCIGGKFWRDFYAAASDNRQGPYDTRSSGDDRLRDVFGLTTASEELDSQFGGGFLFYSDVTNRTAALGGGPVYEPGIHSFVSSDTYGPGPACPTPTIGGTLPDNPLWLAAQNQPCFIDDDAVGEATGIYTTMEWKPSGYDPT